MDSSPRQTRASRGHRSEIDGTAAAGRSGEVVGARSGDKGGDANLGVWARTDDGYAVAARLADRRAAARAAARRPPTSTIERYELPNLRAVNFVIHGLLGEGVAASTRFDPQAKALGELLRARLVDLP